MQSVQQNDIVIVGGTRPNFVKIGPLMKKLSGNKILVHTGQHYDTKMSEIFFKELSIPNPDYYLGIGSGQHGEQTGRIIIELEKLLIKTKPKIIIVVGDVNSTVASAIAAKKVGIKIAHVEAGLRSFDREMPEEINRLITDSISDILFVTEESGVHNLIKEGISQDRIHFVGNVMIDSLIKHSKNINLEKKNQVCLTMHRPSNVDNISRLQKYMNILSKVDIKIVWPVHPRLKKIINNLRIPYNLELTEPLGYIEFLKLMISSKFVMTDSGGIQEETTYLNIPCLTLRNNTERPSTVIDGSNELVGNNEEKIIHAIEKISHGKWKQSKVHKLWDGNASERIAGIIENECKKI